MRSRWRWTTWASHVTGKVGRAGITTVQGQDSLRCNSRLRHKREPEDQGEGIRDNVAESVNHDKIILLFSFLLMCDSYSPVLY
ncbi:hypothetical protein JOB18_013670 [Solea senegalensis]|nr:hypothetical protein JOB18_013670 [Solea senegalensis]